MNQLKEFYNLVGSDFEDVVRRFNGNPDMVKRFVLKFPSDESFSNLKSFLEKNNGKEAFLAVHTLKGICANLGFTRLYSCASDVTELLREEKTDEAKKDFTRLETEYTHLIESIKKIF